MTSAAGKQRMTWMDVLRGTAIGLVILWHSTAILRLYDLPVPAALVSFNEFFSPFRMPTLMFLSGMLLTGSLRKSARVYYPGKLRFVAYPLVIWTLVHYFLYQPTMTLLNYYFWITTYLWFLVYILVFYLISPLIKWLPTWIAIVTPLLIDPLINGESRRRFFFLAVFFFLGKWATEHREVFDRFIGSRLAWLCAPVATVFGVFSAVTMPTRYESLYAVFSAVGIVALIKVAQILSVQRWTAPLRYVGVHSLIYYVTHFPTIIVVVLIGEGKFGLPIVLVITIGFAAAVAVGTVCARLAEISVVRWLFIAPARGDLQRFGANRHRYNEPRQAKQVHPLS